MAAVNVTINAVLEVSSFSMSPADRAGIQRVFNPQIILDGKVVGNRTSNVLLEQGTSHRIEFAIAESNLYYFDGPVPSSIDFTIATNSTGETFTTTFTGRVKQETGRLTINAVYDPPLPDGSVAGKIIIQGGQALNASEIILRPNGQGVSTGQLIYPPGEYNVFFEDVQVPNVHYDKPAPFTIRVRAGSTQTETRVYQGLSLPPIYWLKPIPLSSKKIDTVDNSIGMFSDAISNLTTFFTSSISETSDRYYTQVYHKKIDALETAVQFSLAYGHVEGSGSIDEGGQVNDTATRAIYGQYRNLILGTSESKINLSGTPTKHFYVLSFQRARKQNKLDYNALEINLAHLSGSQFINGNGYMAAHTGSNVTLGGQGKVLRLISDYKLNPTGTLGLAGLEYNIISGSIEAGAYSPNSPRYYGKLYDSLGVVLLDAVKLDLSASFGTVTSREIDGKNQLKLFTAISGAALYTNTSGQDYLGMKARGIVQEISHHYFIDIRSKEFNYSNNPTYTNSEATSQGEISGTSMETRPKVYITTIGLYDEQRNLIAVAKTSQPEKKSLTDEVIYNVKLKL